MICVGVVVQLFGLPVNAVPNEVHKLPLEPAKDNPESKRFNALLGCAPASPHCTLTGAWHAVNVVFIAVTAHCMQQELQHDSGYLPKLCLQSSPRDASLAGHVHKTPILEVRRASKMVKFK